MKVKKMQYKKILKNFVYTILIANVIGVIISATYKPRVSIYISNRTHNQLPLMVFLDDNLVAMDTLNEVSFDFHFGDYYSNSNYGFHTVKVKCVDIKSDSILTIKKTIFVPLIPINLNLNFENGKKNKIIIEHYHEPLI